MLIKTSQIRISNKEEYNYYPYDDSNCHKGKVEESLLPQLAQQNHMCSSYPATSNKNCWLLLIVNASRVKNTTVVRGYVIWTKLRVCCELMRHEPSKE
jgi:hypothetical protein